MPGIVNRGFAPPKKHKGGGLFGDVWHVVSGTGRGLYHGVTGLPTGAYMTGRAFAHDAVHNPFSVLPPQIAADAFRNKGSRTSRILRNVAKQEYNSYRHFGKGGDISGPLLDASALFTGGATLGARSAKAIGEISKAAQAERAARAVELNTKDAAVSFAKGGSGVKGQGFDKAAAMFKLTSKELKKHASAQENKFGLAEGNLSVGKPKGVQGKYANVPPGHVLKNSKHPLYDFYAARNPEKIPSFTRARKAFMLRPQYSRPLLKGKPFNKRPSGVSVPTSPNPLFRTIRAGREQIRSERSAARDVKKEFVRREQTQVRFLAPKNIRMQQRLTQPPHQGALSKAIGLPMGVLRMAMWARPRYYLQNIAQTGQMLATNPILSAKSTELAKQLYKENKPLYETVRAVTGEAQAGAMAIGTSPSKLGTAIGKRIGGRVGKQIEQRGLQGAMGYGANIPESHVRMISVLNKLQEHHRALGNYSDLTPEAVAKYFANIRRSGVISPEHLPLRRSVESVGDFGRIFSKNMLRQGHMSEREFMATQIPIFYPMFKALTRYGVRFPSEHPILSAAGVALGKQGKKEQKRLLGPLPFWAQYLVPKDAGDPNARRSPREAVFNPSNIYNLQPATDVARQVAEPTRQGGPVPGLSLLQETGPTPGLIYGLLTGHDIQTGYPIKPFSKGFYKKHPGLNRSFINAPADFLQGLPLADLEILASGQRPHVRSFAPGNARDRILQELIGPSVVPRFLKTAETTKQAKRERTYGHGRQKKKREYNP